MPREGDADLETIRDYGHYEKQEGAYYIERERTDT